MPRSKNGSTTIQPILWRRASACMSTPLPAGTTAPPLVSCTLSWGITLAHRQKLPSRLPNCIEEINCAGNSWTFRLSKDVQGRQMQGRCAGGVPVLTLILQLDGSGLNAPITIRFLCCSLMQPYFKTYLVLIHTHTALELGIPEHRTLCKADPKKLISWHTCANTATSKTKELKFSLFNNYIRQNPNRTLL